MSLLSLTKIQILLKPNNLAQIFKKICTCKSNRKKKSQWGLFSDILRIGRQCIFDILAMNEVVISAIQIPSKII